MENNKKQALKAKFVAMFNNAKQKFDSNSEKLKQNIKNTTAAALLTTTILGGATINTGCEQATTPIQAPEIEQTTNENTTVSNNNFKHLNDEIIDKDGNLLTGIVLYNHFNGFENIDIKHETLNEDVAKYLKEHNYFQSQLDDFDNSLQNRPRARQYFDEYLTQGKTEIATANEAIDGESDFAPFIKNAANLGFPLTCKMVDIYSKGDYQKATYFYALYALLNNEAYRFGLGELFNKYPDLQQKYVDTIHTIVTDYKSAHPDKTFTDKDLQNLFCIYKNGANGFTPVLNDCTCFDKGLAFKMQSILEDVAPQMGPEIITNDSLNIISYQLNASSLIGPRDYMAQAGYYQNSEENNFDLNTMSPALKLKNYIESKYKDQQFQQNETLTR